MSQPKSLGLFKTQVKTVFLYQSSDQLKICQSVSQELEARQRICVRQPLGTCGGAMIILIMESSEILVLQLKMPQPKNESKKIQEKYKKNPKKSEVTNSSLQLAAPTSNPVQPASTSTSNSACINLNQGPTLQAMQSSFQPPAMQSSFQPPGCSPVSSTCFKYSSQPHQPQP